MEAYKFHNGAFFDEEEIFTFGPCVFKCISEELTFVVGEELNVFVVKVLVDGGFNRGVLTIIEEEVVVNVFLVNSFAEFFVDLFEIGKGVNVRDFVLFGVIVDFIIVEFVIILDVSINVGLALYQ